MKQKIFSLVLLALCVVAASAGVKNATTLCIENLRGEVVQFPLTESPKMTFKGNFIVVQASATKVIRFKDVRQVYFTDGATGINDATAGEEIDNQLNTITLNKFAANIPVRVYTTSGMIVKQATTDSEGSLQISTGDLSRGTYIIKAGKTAFKFIKR